jgi:PAS domain S-box-containing protein
LNYQNFKRNLLVPIRELAKAHRRFGEGDNSVRAREGSLDEIGDLYRSFNQMADKLNQAANERRLAMQALRESEERYRSLTNDVLDSSEVGVFILDSDFRVVWVNQSLEHYFGLRRDEVVGKDKRQLIHERIKDIFEDTESFTEKVLATYDNNTYIENFECHVLPDSKRKERWLEHWSQPIRSGLYAGGRIEYYYDITKRKRAEEELQRNYNTQTVINSLQRLLLEDIPLDELLERAIEIILSISWLTIKSMGCIYIVEDDPEVLVMKAKNEFDEARKKACARVPFGKCLCGQAALTQEIQFANRLDDRHEIMYEDITPHGNYCVPILFAGRILGVICVYLKEGHRRDQKEEE